MRRKLKSEPGIDEKKLSWTFSIVLFWQDVYSLSPCGPVRGFRRFRWDGRLLQTSHFYAPVGDVTNNGDGYATSTIPEGQALRKKYLILTVTYKNKLWRDVNGDKMNLLYMAKSLSKWRLTQESLLHQGKVYEERKGLFLFHVCFYATQQPCWRLDTGLIETHPGNALLSSHTLSYGFVPAVVHSLLLVLAGHFFTHSEPFQDLFCFFLVFFASPSPSAILYFISALADARQSEDTGDEAVTCCLHLALHHEQLSLQIYFLVDCGHRRSG